MVRILLVPTLTPLYLYVSTFRNMCAVPNMAVFCSYYYYKFDNLLLKFSLDINNYTDIQPKISIDEISLLWLFCGC